MPAEEIFFDAEERMEKAVSVLKDELKSIRTGRATTGLVEHVRVDYYGTSTPLIQLANIATPSPQLIVIKPYDPASVGDIEKAILQSDLGITPNSDGKLIRLAVPPLSEERRKQLASRVKELGENAKIAIRNIRRDANKQVDREKKDSVMSEDEAERAKKDIQESTHEYESQVDELLDGKTKELMQI